MKRCPLALSSVFLFAVSLFCRATAAAEVPNILFIIADDASQKLGETYGAAWIKTPNIDRLARAGLAFDHAYVPTSKCAPCRAGILTGRNPWQLEAAGNHQAIFPPQYKAFTEALAEAGVHVGSFGKTWGPGRAQTADDKPRDFALRRVPFARFLAERPAGKPFFYWYGSTNPHRPYTAGAGQAAGKKAADIDRVPGYWPDNETVRHDLLDYATEVEAFDREVATLLEVLDASDAAANTLVVVTSDHGMPFPRVKGHTYDDAHRVPLVMRWPAGVAKPGRRVAELVSSIDFAPTFLALQGVDAARAGMAAVTGRSLTDLLKGDAVAERPFVLIGRERNDVYAREGSPFGLGYPARAIRAGEFLLVRNFTPDRWPCGDPDKGLLDTDGSPTKKLLESYGPENVYWQHAFGKRPAVQLFHVGRDPDCLTNLAADPTHAATRDRLLAQLTAELERQKDPRILGKGDLFDQYPAVKPPPRK